MTSLGKVTKPGWCRGWFFAFGVPMGSLFWRGPWIRFGCVTRAWQIDDEKAWPSKIYHTFWIRFFPPNDVFKFIPSDLKKMAWPSRRATNESSKALRHLFLLKNWTFKSIYLSIYIIILYIHIHLPSIFKGRHERFVPLSVGDAWCRCAPLRFAALRFSLEIPRTRLCRSYRPSSSACKNARLGMGNDDWGRWSNRWGWCLRLKKCFWASIHDMTPRHSILDMRRESGLSIE